MKLQNKAFEAHIRNRPRKGWSLVELLFVMLIIVSLAGMIAAAAGPVKTRIARYRAEGRLKALQTALDGYKAEYGSYPICEDPEKDGARVLYTTLFGDYNGNGMPDHFPEDEDDPSVKTFMEKLRPSSLDEQGRPVGGPSMVLPDGDSYSVVDNWGQPFYYANYKPGSDPKTPHGGGKFNSGGSYDLWSLGNDPDPTDDNRSMWIKNW